VGVRLSGEEVNDYGADSILQFQIDRRGRGGGQDEALLENEAEAVSSS
jgi:hypothetical protein